METSQIELQRVAHGMGHWRELAHAADVARHALAGDSNDAEREALALMFQVVTGEVPPDPDEVS